jgi:DNA polymerase elongation subunit (family B)
MDILYWDVETSTMDILIRTYQLKNNMRYFSPDDIVREGVMFGAAWVFNDNKRVESVAVDHRKPLDDKVVIEKLHGVLDRADVLVGHNSDQFDLKMFNTRAICYGLPPIGQKVQIDTLKMARKYFRFPSNKLSYIARRLGVGAKDESPDWDLVLEGNKKELEYMRRYNRQDVVVTREVYYKLRAWHHTHPRVKGLARDVAGEEVRNCRKCGGVLRKNGTRLTASGKVRQQMTCTECGGYQTEAQV